MFVRFVVVGVLIFFRSLLWSFFRFSLLRCCVIEGLILSLLCTLLWVGFLFFLSSNPFVVVWAVSFFSVCCVVGVFFIFVLLLFGWGFYFFLLFRWCCWIFFIYNTLMLLLRGCFSCVYCFVGCCGVVSFSVCHVESFWSFFFFRFLFGWLGFFLFLL